VTFFQFRSFLSFGKESSPSRMRAKKPVKSMLWNNRSSCWEEWDRFSRT
jgi:hypothetical protein